VDAAEDLSVVNLRRELARALHKPLQTIVGAAGLLLDNPHLPATDRQRILESILDQVHGLDRLRRDLDGLEGESPTSH
jgi:nitrogen-specific signal transduction histidine kinase